MKTTDQKVELIRLSDYARFVNDRLMASDYKRHTTAYKIAVAVGKRIHSLREGGLVL